MPRVTKYADSPGDVDVSTSRLPSYPGRRPRARDERPRFARIVVHRELARNGRLQCVQPRLQRRRIQRLDPAHANVPDPVVHQIHHHASTGSLHRRQRPRGKRVLQIDQRAVPGHVVRHPILIEIKVRVRTQILDGLLRKNSDTSTSGTQNSRTPVSRPTIVPGNGPPATTMALDADVKRDRPKDLNALVAVIGDIEHGLDYPRPHHHSCLPGQVRYLAPRFLNNGPSEGKL